MRQVDAILFLDVRALLWTSSKRLLAWRRYLQVRLTWRAAATQPKQAVPGRLPIADVSGPRPMTRRLHGAVIRASRQPTPPVDTSFSPIVLAVNPHMLGCALSYHVRARVFMLNVARCRG